MDYKILKYPRTPHLQGSRLQEGDYDLNQIPFQTVLNKYIVIEEKIDGANCAISFDGKGNLLLQSRGHYLVGGEKERDFNLFKQWANENRELFYSVLNDRYIMYGEWMYVKHAIFYDCLPAYFMEFDIYDRYEQIFLSTEERRKLTEKLAIHSVPVLKAGIFKNKKEILSLIQDSNYISENFLENLKLMARKAGADEEKICAQTEKCRTMEGLYIKVEENGRVVDRMKFVRNSYKQQTEQLENWHTQKIITNMLKN